ncbi:MAG: helix-turn-helix domain-containing protein, partial [Gemmatimonadales bacterium]
PRTLSRREMPGPPAQALRVSPQQQRVLERIVRRQTSTQQQARRATIILGAASGANNGALGRRVGVTEDTARLWRGRWAERADALLAAEAEGGEAAVETVVLGILADEPRSGTPATFTPEQICQIVALACEPPAASGRPLDRWTPRELADEAMARGIVPRISPQSVERFLKGSRRAAPPEPVLAHAGPG